MKIIIITPRVPETLDKGDKLRIFHQIQYLSKFHEIHLISLSPKLNFQKKFKIKQYIKSFHVIETSIIERVLNLFYYTVIKKLPIQVSYYYSKKSQKRIDKIIKQIKPQWIYSQLIRTAEYVKNKPEKKIIDFMDSFSLGLKRRSEKSNPFMKKIIDFEYRRVLKYESDVFNYFNIGTIISEFDKQNINHKNKKNIFVVENGINTNYFKRKSKIKVKNTILFVGNMSYKPNVLAATFICKKIFPLIQKKIPNCKVIIAGSNPNKEVLNLSKLSKNIQITGFLEDIRDAYEKANVFIAPMFIGSGLQNKLLEAMSMQIPCITTKIANQSLQATKNEIIIANNEQDFSKYCIELFNNPKKVFFLTKNGYKFVKSKFDWNISTEQLNKLLNS